MTINYFNYNETIDVIVFNLLNKQFSLLNK